MISTAAFLALAIQCAPDIAPDTMSRIVKTESGFNPWAIGVVGKSLSRQPQTRDEALEAIKNLYANNDNFSVGLAQINRQYFSMSEIESVFVPCNNLKMGADILKDCYSRALSESESEQHALRKSFSCYYSGNYTRGFKKEGNGKSYVDRIVLANNNVKVPALDGATEVMPAPERVVPEYDSWDVLQQYPKYRKPEAQRSEAPVEKRDEEKTDVTKK